MRILIGVTLLATGVVWFFQGLGAIDGYGMSGHAEWSVIGVVVIVIAIGLLVGARKLRDGDDSRVHHVLGRTSPQTVPGVRRPSETIIDELVRDYVAGSSIDSLAERLRVHRTTIIGYLERSGIERRRNVRKMTDRSVRQAAKRYASDESLKVVAARFDVDAKTLAREFKRAGIEIRTRRGWHPRT